MTVFFCGDDEAHAGAIELWANHPTRSKDMRLVEGYYGNTGDTFEFVSRSTSFRQGNGLPGLTWDADKPVFMDNLGKGSGFLRADSARQGRHQPRLRVSLLKHGRLEPGDDLPVGTGDADRAAHRDLGTRRRCAGSCTAHWVSRKPTADATPPVPAPTRASHPAPIGAAFASGVPQVETPMFACRSRHTDRSRPYWPLYF